MFAFDRVLERQPARVQEQALDALPGEPPVEFEITVIRFFANSCSLRDISAIVRRRAETEERKDGHLAGRRAARGG